MLAKKKHRIPRIYYILAAILIIGFVVIRVRQAGADKPIIRTASVERGTVTAIVSANGTLQPITTVEVKSNVGGTVLKLAVDEGDRVKKGQLIARIDPTDTQTVFDQAQADLAASISKVDQAHETLSMQHEQNTANIMSAEQGLESARAKLMQAEEQSRIQPTLTTASIKQARNAYAAAVSVLKQEKAALVPQKQSSAQASYDQARASYVNSESDLKRQKALLEKGYVSKSTVETAEEKYEVNKAAFESAKRKLDTIKAETDEDLGSAQAKVEQAKADLDSALANQVQVKIKKQDVASAQAALKQAESALRVAQATARQNRINQGTVVQANSEVVRNRATVKNAKTQLGYTTVVAPCDGVVTKKYVENGSIVTAGKSSALGTGSGVAIVDIADETRMTALVDVDETDIAQIRVGQDVNISVEAYPDEQFSGKVTKIAPQSSVTDSVTTIPVTVEVKLPDARLKPGMNVTCDFITDNKQNVLLVPNEAIKEIGQSSIVTVLEGDKQVTRQIEAGLVGKDYTEILKGLREGEKVVTAVLQKSSDSSTSDSSATTSKSSKSPGLGGPGMMGGPPPK